MKQNFGKHVFISDVHLGGFDDKANAELEATLLSVLEWAKKEHCKIHFLGDIFDYWMEFNSGFYPKEFKNVLDALKKIYVYQGPTLFVTGNHDNWTLGHFEHLGMETVTDYQVLELDSKRFFLMHGDGLIQENGKLKRPWLHQILRNSTFLWFYRNLLKDRTGIKIMQWFSNLNRKFRPTTPKDSIKLDTWFRDFSQELDVSFVLCGHDHNPRTIRLNQTKYINLGAFYEHKTFALYTNSELKLVYWNHEQNQPLEYPT